MSFKKSDPLDSDLVQILELDEEINAIESEIARIRRLKENLNDSSLPGHSSSISLQSSHEFVGDDQISSGSDDYPDLDILGEDDWDSDDLFGSSDEDVYSSPQIVVMSEINPISSHTSIKNNKRKKSMSSLPLMSKDELVHTITHLLPESKLSGVIDIVSESCAPLVTTDSDDIEFDITSIDDETLVALSDYVRNCLADLTNTKPITSKSKSKSKSKSSSSNKHQPSPKKAKTKKRSPVSKKSRKPSPPAKKRPQRSNVRQRPFEISFFTEEEVIRIEKTLEEDEFVDIC